MSDPNRCCAIVGPPHRAVRCSNRAVLISADWQRYCRVHSPEEQQFRALARRDKAILAWRAKMAAERTPPPPSPVKDETAVKTSISKTNRERAE